MLVFTLAVVARALLAPPPQGKEQHLEEEEEEEGSGGSADDLPSYLHAPRVPTPEPRPWPTLRSLLTEGAVDAPQPPHPPDGSSLRSHRGGRTRAASPSSRLPPPPPSKGKRPPPLRRPQRARPGCAGRGAARSGAVRGEERRFGATAWLTAEHGRTRPRVRLLLAVFNAAEQGRVVSRMRLCETHGERFQDSAALSKKILWFGFFLFVCWGFFWCACVCVTLHKTSKSEAC